MEFNVIAYFYGKQNDESGKALDLISYLLGKASGGGGGGGDSVVGTAIVGTAIVGGNE